jgi:HlyD family secretion protein
MIDWLCGIAVFSAWLCAAPAPLSGYIEGESRYLAPITAARIETIHVQRGDDVHAGDLIATLDSGDSRQELAGTEALLAEAEARLANLTTGKRAEEIAVLEAARDAARAELHQRELDLSRSRDLVDRGMQNRAALDAALSARDVAKARLGEVNANLRVAGIAARAREIDAARSVVTARQADVERARWRFDQRVIRAPEDGRMEDIIRYAGEVAAPNAPLAVLLPPHRRKLRVFIPEAEIAGIKPGDTLTLGCDGCPPITTTGPLTAVVDFIASEPEYTPPVLYSVEHRQKLVVLVEARLTGQAVGLNAGQIVDVFLPDKHE